MTDALPVGDTKVRIVRLASGDMVAGHQAFLMLCDVFETPGDPLSDEYVAGLLGRSGMWVMVACDGDEIVGAVTAHELPMTRSESTELFIYDLAVRPEHQRRGIGRALIQRLLTDAAADGVDVAFVPADDEDIHALEFYTALGGRPSPVTIFDFG